jgi:hypothetical protein
VAKRPPRRLKTAADSGPVATPEPPSNLVPGAFLIEMRRRFGLTPRDLSRLLRIGRGTLWRYERHGAPAWVALACAGIALHHFGLGVAEVAAWLGINPDAEPERGPDGRLLPVLPSLGE